MTTTLPYTDCDGEETLVADIYVDHEGTTHHVLVDHYRGTWTVLDAVAPFKQPAVIERVPGSLNEARAIAASYLVEMERYLAGERDGMTVPHPAPKADEIRFTKTANMPDGLRALHDRQLKPKALRRGRATDAQQITLELAA